MVHLFFVDAVETTGSKCAHVCADAFGSYVFGANYASGSVLVTRSDENGQLTMTDLCTTLWAQYSASPAGCAASTCGHSDAGRNRGHRTRSRDGQIGKLQIGPKVGKTGSESQSASCTKSPLEKGPRHFVFHPCGRYGYLLTEIGNHILRI